MTYVPNITVISLSFKHYALLLRTIIKKNRKFQSLNNGSTCF